MTDSNLPQPAPENLSARYRLWLSVSLLLALATVTFSVVVIIIANARDRNRGEEFDATLTAVWQHVQTTPVALDITPTVAPRISAGRYPFTADQGAQYAASDSCALQIISGQILDTSGSPTDHFSVRVWGDYTRALSLFTGEQANESPGVWTVALTDTLNRRLWVQVMEGTRYVSPPVEVVFNVADCERNRANITFTQVLPLD